MPFCLFQKCIRFREFVILKDTVKMFIICLEDILKGNMCKHIVADRRQADKLNMRALQETCFLE